MFRYIILICVLPLLSSLAAENDITKDSYEAFRGSRVSWARGKFIVKSDNSRIRNWEWFLYPSADLKFLEQLCLNTSVNMEQEWNVVSFKRLDHMIAFPQIFLSGEHFIDMHKVEEDNLKEYLLRGGMIWVDDCVWTKQNYFYRSMIAKLKQLFPGLKLRSYKTGHEVLSYFYKFSQWIHFQGINTGITFAYYKGRLIAVLSGSDLHCAWVGAGWFKPFPIKRNQGYRMGINIYLYSMTH